MKCKIYDSCRKGWFESRPNDYVCVGVRKPFVIEDINAECTEYDEWQSKRETDKEKAIQRLIWIRDNSGLTLNTDDIKAIGTAISALRSEIAREVDLNRV